MKQKLVILRSDRMATRDIFRGPSPLDVAIPPEIKVEVDEVERRDIPKLTRGADVLAVAPAMPMKLVEPLDIHEATQEEAGDIAWGIKAVKADTSSCTGEGIVVAVLDTGIDATHPAFTGVELVQRNFTDEGGADLHGHGTHCAGTIFGRNVGELVLGWLLVSSEH
ncbi:S8 family serine peptidase [Azotobacter chroococcum]